MEFGVLGPVVVRTTTGWIASGGPRQQLLLAALALEAGRVVPFGELADRVWDGRPPGTGHSALWPHVSRLRRELAAGPGEPAELERTPGGYRLRVAPDRVDAHRFAGLLAEIRRGQPDRPAAEGLDAALGLWRGEPLAGLPGRWAAAIRTGLQQQRVEALVLRGGILVRLGRAEEALPALVALADELPLVESVAAALIRALAAAGRRPEALERYRQARRRLGEELGLDPGDDLTAAHQEALSGFAAAAPEPPAPPVTPSAVTRPAQLPPAVPHLTGRDRELAWLDRAAESAPVPAVVTGPGGVGKTALVLQWAHRMIDAFPDGQLYVNLRGYDPDLPLPAAEALTGFLHALGVPGQEVPLDPQARAARFRSEVSRRRMLLVLDNAAGVDQVRPLLPGPGPAVVVTSRDTLAGLVAVNGAGRLELGMLPPDEAVRLLRRLDVPVDAEPAAARELAGACAGLPLALRVAAELTATSGPAPIAELVRELADHGRRLDVLRIPGDAQGRVDTVFSWSYRRLAAGPARAFRLLSLHPADSVEAYGLAALTGSSPARSRQTLDLLRRANLLEAAGAGRFRWHDLLRAYARGRSDLEDGRVEQDAAFGRLCRYSLATTAAAAALVHPGTLRPEPAPQVGPPPQLPELPDRAVALAWLDTERAGLLAVVAAAAERGRADDVAALSQALFRYLNQGWFAEARTLYELALQVAVDAGRPADRAMAQLGVAVADFALGHGPDARDGLLLAIDLFDELGDVIGSARCHANLGTVLTQLGDTATALAHLDRSRSMFQGAGVPEGEARALVQTVVLSLRMGRYDEEAQQRALLLLRRLGDRAGEACALSNQAVGLRRTGRLVEAERAALLAVQLHREVGSVDGEGVTLSTLGLIQAEAGRLGPALDLLRQGLDLHLRSGNRECEAEARNDLGVGLGLAGEVAAAVREHTTALSLAVAAGDRIEQARAHQQLAALLPAGDPAAARHRSAAASLSGPAGPVPDDLGADRARTADPLPR